MTAPGAPSVPNVLAMKALGTSSTADLIGGIIFAGVLQYIMAVSYTHLDVYKRQDDVIDRVEANGVADVALRKGFKN